MQILPSSDLALWNLQNSTETSIIIRNGPTNYQNNNANFAKSGRQYMIFNKKTQNSVTVTRYLSQAVFTRQLYNGEIVNRDWLLYSASQGSVYCFTCRLFSKKKKTFASNGFNDWKHLNLISEHECGPEHTTCMIMYAQRQNDSGCMESELLKEFYQDQQYWKKVLQRIVAVIKFLASRGLAFRGDNQTLGSNQNGNYLGILELVSQFDPFLCEHLKKYGNCGKGTTSYLSANICEEFISLIGKRVQDEILKEINESKYYSIGVDLTPDVSHMDQLSFTVRYVKENVPTERFLEFIPIYSHGSEYLANTVLAYLAEKNIPITDCRGHSYDNASNMAGHYSGLQARIKSVNQSALYVPCAAHSLNLVGNNAAQCCLEVVSFLD